MTKESSGNKPGALKRCLNVFVGTRRRRWIVGIVLAVLIALPFVLTYVVIPTVIRGQAVAAAAGSWEGDLSIGEIDFNWRGPSTFRDVKLTDTRGKPWMEIGSLSVTLADFPGFAPKLAVVELDTLTLNAQLTDGKLVVPIKVSEEDEEPMDIGRLLALRRVHVRNITVNAVDGDRTVEVFHSDELLMEGTPEKLVMDSFKGRLAGGRMVARLTLVDKPDRTLTQSGRLELVKVQLGKMLRDLGTGVDMKEATVDWLTWFDGENLSPQTTRSHGVLHVAEAHVGTVPVLSKVMGFFGLADPSDFTLNAKYAADGYLITLKDAGMANNLSAFKAEPGGTIDLDRQTVDLYVIGAMFGEVKSFLADIPIVNILAGATQKLAERTTRVRVKGRFDDPPSSLLAKQPLKDLAEGTVGFFKDAVEGGGNLGNDVLKQTGRLLREAAP